MDVGITSEADISGPNASSIVPDFVVQSLGDLRVLKKEGMGVTRVDNWVYDTI